MHRVVRATGLAVADVVVARPRGGAAEEDAAMRSMLFQLHLKGQPRKSHGLAKIVNLAGLLRCHGAWLWMARAGGNVFVEIVF